MSLSEMNDGAGPTIDSRPGKLFRRRFRVPWILFRKLLTLCRTHNLFGPHADDATDCTGIDLCPIELKLMGVLRMLGRAWICDDVAEATGMGESTVRLAFRTFTDNLIAAFYDVYIYRPTGEKLARMMNVYSRMGLSGCIGSTDCVHLKWDRCPVSLTNLCKGKEGYPTVVYSCVVDHNRRILSVSASNYGTRNDKTLVRLDDYIMDVKNKKEYADVEYTVWVGGERVTRRGVWFLCDGGYHKWCCMINPMKHTSCREERLWSEWMESTRKDVECCFGILKSRFRILKNGLLCQTQEGIDRVFYTCCILHNMLLEVDGLDTRWETDVDWEALNPQGGNDDEGYDEFPVMQSRGEGGVHIFALVFSFALFFCLAVDVGLPPRVQPVHL